MTTAAQENGLAIGRRVALWGVFVSAVLAIGNIAIGMTAGSTSVIAAGAEFAGDVLASALVAFGMTIAVRPADSDHPYGHGKYETLAAFLVGIILAGGGVGICWRSLERVSELHDPPASYAAWPLLAAILLRGIMAVIKFRIGRRIRSASLIADAWNDAVDILSAMAALVALGLTILNPSKFLAADHYGGFAVGLVVVFTGLRIMRDTSLDLTDAMPESGWLEEIRRQAMDVPGVAGVEKCLARKAGLQYYVDLHIEVDPMLTVRASHEIAGAVRSRVRQRLPWVADVLVHVEPASTAHTRRP
jgi:cation diffusion facilitator family transporter